MSTLSKEVTCVGCRRSVESLVQRLYKTGDSALEPLVITEDGVISVSRDHILAPQVSFALNNLIFTDRSKFQDHFPSNPGEKKILLPKNLIDKIIC